MCRLLHERPDGAKSKRGDRQLPDAALIEKGLVGSLTPELHCHFVRASLGFSFTHFIVALSG
ncbi:MAG: hypothetical protein DME59_11655 [Verrucomicrobia bacterium]|nr:MAG: hypothetical protein DME59_11655 [Verrucomicrobiota bacterium]